MEIIKGDKSKLTTQQLESIDIITNPNMDDMTFEQIAEKVGCSVRTIHRWRKEYDYKVVLMNVAMEKVQFELPKIFNALVKSASGGSAKSAEILLKAFSLLGTTSQIEVTDNRKAEDDAQMAKINSMMAELKALEDEEVATKAPNVVKLKARG